MFVVDGKVDFDEVVYFYVQEFGGVVFDICLLGMGIDGYVVFLFLGYFFFNFIMVVLVVGVMDVFKFLLDCFLVMMFVINRLK